MVKVGIIGATGYAGAELVRILLNHKEQDRSSGLDQEAISMKIMQIFTETFLNLSMQTVWVITWMSLLPAWM